jgi:hypothetical protein
MVLRSVGVLSAGKILGSVYAVMGLILGAFFSLFAMAGVAANGNEAGETVPFLPFFGVGAIIVVPIVYGLMGFFLGAIGAAIYNLAAGFIGGIEMHFEHPANI